MKRALQICLLPLLCAPLLCALHYEVRASGTTTITEQTYGPVKKITFDWAVSDTTGVIDTTTTNTFFGQVFWAVTDPDTAAANRPNDSYAVYLYTADGYDALGGDLVGCDSSAAYETSVLNGGSNGINKLGMVADKLRLYISGADSASAADYASGVVVVYIR